MRSRIVPKQVTKLRSSWPLAEPTSRFRQTGLETGIAKFTSSSLRNAGQQERFEQKIQAPSPPAGS
jgi:hypothetical protein